MGIGLGGMLGLTALDAGLDFLGNRAMMKGQQAFQENSARHQYQWAVEDMKKAGLNPILAATGGLSGARVGGSSGSFSGSRFAANALVAADLKKKEAETALVESNTKGQELLNKGLEADLPKKQFYGGAWGGANKAGEGVRDILKKALDWLLNGSEDVKAIDPESGRAPWYQQQKALERRQRDYDENHEAARRWNMRVPDADGGYLYFNKSIRKKR